MLSCNKLRHKAALLKTDLCDNQVATQLLWPRRQIG